MADVHMPGFIALTLGLYVLPIASVDLEYGNRVFGVSL